MSVIVQFDPKDHVRRRLLLIAATNLGLSFSSHVDDAWIIVVEANAEDVYRLGLEHGRLMNESEHANADTH